NEFFDAADGPGWGKCPACLRTMPHFQEVVDEAPESREICDGCARDVELGGKLSTWHFNGAGQPVVQRTDLVRHFPSVHGHPASFEELVECAAGKQWLGHLRIDADNIGKTFDALGGDPRRTWGLSRLLHTFFCQYVQERIESQEFESIYP